VKPQRHGPFPYVPINRRPRLTWPNGARVAEVAALFYSLIESAKLSGIEPKRYLLAATQPDPRRSRGRHATA